MTALLTATRKKKSDEVYTGRRNPLLLAAVFLFAGAAFWYHFENRFESIERDRSLSDKQTLLSAAERQGILALRALLREKWGLLLQVRLGEDIQTPKLSSNGIFVGVLTPVSPKASKKEPVQADPIITVNLPALLEKAIGSDYGSRMQARIAACMRKNRVGQCLDSALLDMVAALEGGEGKKLPAEPEAVKPEATESNLRAPLIAPSEREVRGSVSVLPVPGKNLTPSPAGSSPDSVLRSEN